MAVEKKELPQLEKLYQRGLENGVKDLKILDSKEIKDVEPYCEVKTSSGYIKGMAFSPSTGHLFALEIGSKILVGIILLSRNARARVGA